MPIRFYRYPIITFLFQFRSILLMTAMITLFMTNCSKLLNRQCRVSTLVVPVTGFVIRPKNINTRRINSNSKIRIPSSINMKTLSMMRSSSSSNKVIIDQDYDDDEMNFNPNDTIYALSSGSGNSGQATALAVVRLSGPDSTTILKSLLRPSSSSSSSSLVQQQLPKPRYATLRKLYKPSTTIVIDQALVLYFPKPNSYTGEDCVELHCHGSRAVLSTLFPVLSKLGARLAEPGEFTQRAFSNGKLDILQVEALADLLSADTEQQRQQALQQLDGKLSKVYQSWREQLIAGLAHAEAIIDFGDDERLDDDVFHNDDDPFNSDTNMQQQQDNIWGNVQSNMQLLCNNMINELSDQRRGELVREGVKIAIIGPPNVGKSSLFNILAFRDAAIVSPTAGTTRDILEITLNLGGIKCIVQDTAGVRNKTNDIIEQEGMKRAVNAAKQADLVVAMVDSTDKNVGLEILQMVLNDSNNNNNDNENNNNDKLDSKHVVLVMNKSDLNNEQQSITIQKDDKTLNRIGGLFEISCVTQDGIDSFLKDLTIRVNDRVGSTFSINDDDEVSSSSFENVEQQQEGALITRARHRQHVEAAVEALQRFDMLSQQGTMAVDMAAEELRLAASELGRITGAVDVEDVLDKLFTDFCIGK